jgi:hypothetical protein
MPNDTLAADVTRLRAVSPAMLAAPAVNPDSRLLALVLRSKTLRADLAAAEAALNRARDAAQAATVTLYPPPALIFTARDRELFPKIETRIGEPLALLDVRLVEAMRDAMVDRYALIEWGEREPLSGARETLARAVEIVEAGEAHFSRIKAAHDAVGVPAAEDAVTALAGELSHAWREIAFAPARSLLGVLAKLESVGADLDADPLDADDFPAGCEPANVACMAAADLGALLDNREA